MEVQRNAIFTFSRFGVAQHQHCQALHGEAPHHAKRVRFTQQENVSSAQNNREELKPYNQVEYAVRRPETRMRFSKPLWKNSILRDTIQNSIRAYDSGIHGARQHQHAHDHNEAAKYQPQRQRSYQMHRQAANRIVLEASAHRIRNDHYREERDPGGKNQAVNENDNRGLFQVWKLWVLNLAINLRHGL